MVKVLGNFIATIVGNLIVVAFDLKYLKHKILQFLYIREYFV